MFTFVKLPEQVWRESGPESGRRSPREDKFANKSAGIDRSPIRSRERQRKPALNQWITPADEYREDAGVHSGVVKTEVADGCGSIRTLLTLETGSLACS
jgi:hypothetical protein